MKRSLKYRLILLYFLLVFIAMSVVGLFVIKEFTNYNMEKIRLDMKNIADNLISNSLLLSKDDFLDKKNELQIQLQTLPISPGYEISIIEPKDYQIIAGTNTRFISKSAFECLDENVILSSLSTNIFEKDIKSGLEKDSYLIKNISYPQKDETGNIKYIIYIRASLEQVDNMMKSIVSMLLKATIIAIAISIVLGYLMSSTITKPINHLAKKAKIMSGGDFSQRAQVYSRDEIGELSIAFNELSNKIQTTLTQLDGEKNKLDAIIFHMQEGLVAINTKGVIIHTNPTFRQLLGIKKKVIGKYYNDVIESYKDQVGLEQMIELSQKNPQKFLTIKIKNTYIGVSSAPFREKNGQIQGLIIMFQDITQAQKLEEMRKEFVANVSHELKTPITSIKGYSQTLLDGAMEEKEIATSFLKIIDQEADRMTRIITDLLQLSHIDYNKEKWDIQKSDITQLINESIETMLPYTMEKNIQITYNKEKEPFFVNMDKTKIGQCITNLISNAIKYNMENGLIELSTRHVDNWCEICVKDSGIGIPKESIPHLFERFYRVDKGRSRQQGGTGLGLSIVKSIIDEHNGEIYVKSDIGVGSIFMLRLPVDNFE